MDSLAVSALVFGFACFVCGMIAASSVVSGTLRRSSILVLAFVILLNTPNAIILFNGIFGCVAK